MFDGVSAGEAVSMVRDGVTALLAHDPSRLQAVELTELLRAVEAQSRRLVAVAHRVVTDIDERGVAGELCYPSTAAVVQELLHVTGREASARVGAARELTGRHDLTGGRLPPVLPATAAALADGTISPGHARVISTIMGELHAEADTAFGADIEAALAEHSAHLNPAQVAQAGRLMLARLNPGGDQPTDEVLQRKRSFTLSKNPDGSAKVSGQLSPAATAVWDAVLDSLAAPVPAENGAPDDRTPGQRRHDALLDAGQRLLNSSSLPDCGGTPVTVAVTISARDLVTATRDRGHGNGNGNGASFAAYGKTSHGDLISIGELLTLAAEADIIPVVLNDAGGILAYGRTRRLASPAQRRALAARDRGCSFPGVRREALDDRVEVGDLRRRSCRSKAVKLRAA